MSRAACMVREMTRILGAGVAGKVFPGAVGCVGYREAGSIRYSTAVAGHLSPGGPVVEENTVYDLASLTKPVVAAVALRMVEAGKLDLKRPALEILSDVRGAVLGDASLQMLLSHRSGLDAWGGLYLDVPHEAGSGAARRWIVSEAARRRKSTTNPCVYSDLGYIVAGEALSRVHRGTLDAAVREWTTLPLGLADELFFSGERNSALRRAAPTERCEWRGRLIGGEVHDENCAALGGVAGHAGLFGTARAMAGFGRAMLDALAGRSEFLRRESLELALTDPGDGATERLGWDTRSEVGSSAGKRMSKQAFGHLGFTGTSIWCDPKRDVVVVLLTNRIHPSRANEKIRGFRPAFHDGVLAVFDR